MIDQHIKQLKSVDSDRRREAIRALAQSGDPRAIDPLKYAARTDPDPRLRDLAANAIRRIQAPVDSETPQAAPKPVITPLAGPVKREPVRETSEPQPETDEQSKKRAEGHLSRAFEHRIKGETRDAIAELADAVRVDPGLTRDKRAVSLAADLSGEPPEQAINSLLDMSKQRGVRRSRFVFGRDASIFAVEVIILIALLAVTLSLFGSSLVGAVTRGLNPNSWLPAVEAQLTQMFRNVGRVDFMSALPSAVLITGFLLLVDAVTYISGLIQRGTGNVLRFLGLFLALQIGAYLIGVLIQAPLLQAGLAESLVAPAEQTTSWVSTSVSALVIFGTILGGSYIAGRVHRIGFVRGFISVVLANLFLAAVWAILIPGAFGIPAR
jgi:HEAT repeats